MKILEAFLVSTSTHLAQPSPYHSLSPCFGLPPSLIPYQHYWPSPKVVPSVKNEIFSKKHCSFSAHFLTLSKRQQRIANPSSFNLDAQVQFLYSPQKKHQTPSQLRRFLLPVSNSPTTPIIITDVQVSPKSVYRLHVIFCIPFSLHNY